MKNLLSKFSWIGICTLCLTTCTVKSDRVSPSGNPDVGKARKASGDVYCSTITIDWWSVACTNGGEICYWSYMYPETKTDCSYQSSSPVTGFSPAGILLDGYLVPAADQRLQDITISSTLNPAQTTELREALNDFINPCLNNNLFSQLVARGKKFNFAMGSSGGGLAGYNPNTNTITFSSANQITGENLREELFHGYQDIFYNGGIAQYNGHDGESNVEFEAKFFKDLVNVVGSGGGQSAVLADHPKANAYGLWLISMGAAGNFPTVIDLDKYREYLQAFRECYPTHNEPALPNFLPNALMQLIKGSNCSKD